MTHFRYFLRGLNLTGSVKVSRFESFESEPRAVSCFASCRSCTDLCCAPTKDGRLGVFAGREVELCFYVAHRF